MFKTILSFFFPIKKEKKNFYCFGGNLLCSLPLGIEAGCLWNDCFIGKVFNVS